MKSFPVSVLFGEVIPSACTSVIGEVIPSGPGWFQLKAKTEMLLSSEASKAGQRADLENHLETAQNALQDKQQVSSWPIGSL